MYKYHKTGLYICTSTMYAHVHNVQVPQDRFIYYVQVHMYMMYKYRSIHAYRPVLVHHVHVHT